MADLLVVGFKNDMQRASAVLTTLKDMDRGRMVDLDDAVAVYRDFTGRLRVGRSFRITQAQGAALGGLFGALIGAGLAVPFIGGASFAVALVAGAVGGVVIGAFAGALDTKAAKEATGIADDVVEQTGVMVEPGDSAIFALLRTLNPAAVTARFTGYGGSILQTTLDDGQRARVEAMLHAR